MSEYLTTRKMDSLSIYVLCYDDFVRHVQTFVRFLITACVIEFKKSEIITLEEFTINSTLH